MEEERLTQEDIDEINELFGAVPMPSSSSVIMGDGLQINPSEVVERFTEILQAPGRNQEVIRLELEQDWFNVGLLSDAGLLQPIKDEEQPTKVNISELKESIKQIAQENYPNLWDYYPNSSPEFNQIYAGNISRRVRESSDKTDYLIIKFPEIVITNSNKKFHIIKDLYILFCVNYNDNELYLGNYIHGLRGLVTDAEDYSQYRHSHLYGDSSVRFDYFCLGSSEFGHSLLELSSEFDIDKFDYLLNQLDSYVKWESLEGGPYRRIDNIRPRNFENLSNLTEGEIQYCIGRFFDDYHVPLTIDYTYNAQYIFDFDEDKLRELINSINLKKVYKADNSYYNYFTESGDGLVTTKIKQPHALKFRGQQVDITITCKNLKKIDPNWEVVNHPQYATHMISLLRNRIYEYNNKIRFD